MKDPAASSLISGELYDNDKVNVFRLKQSLNDSRLLFWRPWGIQNEKEWPIIFFLKLAEGKLIANKDLGASVLKIDLNKFDLSLNVLEIANKQFLYAKVQVKVGVHCATFNGGQYFNDIEW